MSLLVIPLAPDETEWLTLSEWDQLTHSNHVYFERPDHPLIDRLLAAGVRASAFDDDPAADWDGAALVVDPGSKRTVELAKEGATISVGTTPSPDSLTAAHGAYIARRGASSLSRLALVMARLRSDDGCPWDREQDHESLRVHLIEEAHEVLQAIEDGNLTEGLEEELGDLLLQVVFHAQMAADDERFDLAGVADTIVSKLIHRHPHVFSDTEVENAAEVVRNWETIKAAEKQRSDVLDDVPASLSALLYAYKIQKRAAASGFSADAEQARDKAQAALEGETDEVSLGDALFWLVALCRAAGVDPESALRSAVARFRRSLPLPEP
jgi:MazG family protein